MSASLHLARSHATSGKYFPLRVKEKCFICLEMDRLIDVSVHIRC